ncbi:MAG: acyltransferase, partial [Bacteroidota bacterium]|nr:acyltransferase [Bacteroidota bacterium]
MQPSHRYLSNLTPLRGIAALWVVVFHFSEIVAKFVSTNKSLLLTKGYLMVDLFFIMSGFIIYHVYQQNFQSGISARSFR